MDEFDALTPEAISSIAGVLRNIYIQRQDQADRPYTGQVYGLEVKSFVNAVEAVDEANRSKYEQVYVATGG